MTTITIPKKNSKAKELVAIPREEYEDLLEWKKTAKFVKEYIPTAAQKKDLAQARQEYRKRDYVTLTEFDHELGSTRKGKG